MPPPGTVASLRRCTGLMADMASIEKGTSVEIDVLADKAAQSVRVGFRSDLLRYSRPASDRQLDEFYARVPGVVGTGSVRCVGTQPSCKIVDGAAGSGTVWSHPGSEAVAAASENPVSSVVGVGAGAMKAADMKSFFGCIGSGVSTKHYPRVGHGSHGAPVCGTTGASTRKRKRADRC
jgi:hypothetical protein